MNRGELESFVNKTWDDSIIPALEDYIAIPAKSPLFEANWAELGHIDKAVDHIADWCRSRNIPDMTLEVVRLPGKTPLIFIEIPGTRPPSGSEKTVLLYGHLDKQPEMSGWREGLGPWKPVVEGDKLFGRGGADDGYAAFASLTAVEALHRQGVPFSRCVVMIEASEESGSPDLPAYMDHLSDRIGVPDLVVCLDSGAGDYDRLWCTTSLRGIVVGVLKVNVLTEGVHSGGASGIVPSSFRIARELLARLEDSATGNILVESFHCAVPEDRLEQAKALSGIVGGRLFEDFPVTQGLRPVTEDLTELALNNSWRPALSVTGASGFSHKIEDAGNVLRPGTALKLSLRLPPLVDGEEATTTLKNLLEADPPYGASVEFDAEGPGSGWNAPALAGWLEAAMAEASQEYFGNPAAFMGEGGSIPFMHMLGEQFPKSQFLITGLLGPHSNAHGPNEFLHIPAGKKLTSCVADVIAAQYRKS